MEPERADRGGSTGSRTDLGRPRASSSSSCASALRLEQLVQIVDHEQRRARRATSSAGRDALDAASPSNSGRWRESSIGPSAPAAPRSASTTDSQKRCASRSSRSTDTQAVRSPRPAASIHDRSRTVLPLPAGAETSVTPAEHPQTGARTALLVPRRPQRTVTLSWRRPCRHGRTWAAQSATGRADRILVAVRVRRGPISSTTASEAMSGPRADPPGGRRTRSGAPIRSGSARAIGRSGTHHGGRELLGDPGPATLDRTPM